MKKEKKKDKKKSKNKNSTRVRKKMNSVWWLPFIIILIFGIVLMNMTYCDADRKMHFGEVFGNIFGVEQTAYNGCKPGTIYCEYDCPVPIPPCLETDNGRDYLSYGEIRSGVGIDDICLDNGDLRERYCNSDLTYTSEDIDCAIEYEINWTCEEGECRYNETVLVGGDEDNGEDGIDCTHDSIYPSCLGSCDFEPAKTYSSETMCASVPTNDDGTEGMCICMSNLDIACGQSNAMDGISCDGYCAYNMFCIHQLDSDNCYCDNSPCYETDDGYDIFTPGYCIDAWGNWNGDFCNGDWLEEYQCNPAGCSTFPTDCESLIGNYHCLEDENDVGYCGELLE